MVDNVMRTYFILEPTRFTLLMLLKWNFVSPQVSDHGTSSPLRDVVRVWKRLHVKFQSADVFPKGSASAVSFKKLNRLAFAKGRANAVSFKMKLFSIYNRFCKCCFVEQLKEIGSVNWFECVSYLCRKDIAAKKYIKYLQYFPTSPPSENKPPGSNFMWYYLLESLSSQIFPLR